MMVQVMTTGPTDTNIIGTTPLQICVEWGIAAPVGSSLQQTFTGGTTTQLTMPTNGLSGLTLQPFLVIVIPPVGTQNWFLCGSAADTGVNFGTSAFPAVVGCPGGLGGTAPFLKLAAGAAQTFTIIWL